MADKRKPSFVFLLKNQGKKKWHKVELFHRSEWIKNGPRLGDTYRLRINGRWYDNRKDVNRKFHTKTQVMNLLAKSIDPRPR